ncbi:phosphoribosyltransferase [Paraburkholderia caballeronis]|uniref:phosphoribosyltransferase n=1 Tax=Paraburkholderia caballeronis TaxID=416943 RepID=UPI00106521C5|nr:phosphoribosyltransferase family protein [Paraburkholderia caballeronis]TDV06093.1 putative phosphoribosyl transferase [Paraburkholderia caballeronis]TDV09633.1 putative phosphoribosyl transferase [Paraburkholderia caballeronis]TDV21698.1 putative phosphoribosyl transferase [Paraburkholderia caballeronis]
MERLFIDRRDAGRQLAERLGAWAGRDDVVVLGLPRGGVPVAFEVAAALGAPLDVLPVCKVRMPWQPELALGALSSNGAQYIDHQMVRESGIAPSRLDEELEKAREELARREALYRGGRAPAPVAGRIAIVVDDGMATGAALKAAALALAPLRPARIVAALPVAPADGPRRVGDAVDELVCVQMPPNFMSVGQFYRDFEQTSDGEVNELLERAAGRRCAG